MASTLSTTSLGEDSLAAFACPHEDCRHSNVFGAEVVFPTPRIRRRVPWAGMSRMRLLPGAATPSQTTGCWRPSC